MTIPCTPAQSKGSAVMHLTAARALPEPSDPPGEKPLTAKQQQTVTAELHLYFSGFFRAGRPYQMPTFRAVIMYYPRDEVPEGLSTGEVTRRALHHISDPTPAQAFELMYGSPDVPVWVGERKPIEAAEFKRLSLRLPTHLKAAFDMLLASPGRYVDAPEKMGCSRETAARYEHDTIVVIASWLYGQRWSGASE